MFKLFPEQQAGTEKKAEVEKPLETEVRLEIFRHSKKENDPNRPNLELLLTPEGRALAHEKGLELNPDVNVSVAGASLMDRAAETAMLAMLANEDKIKVGDSLGEMNDKVAEEIKMGKKIYRDDRLGFNLDGPVHHEGETAFKSGYYMKWLSEDSDKQAIEKGDKISTTYLRQAGNIAELVNRYSKIGNNFNRLADEKKKDGEEFPLHLERYLATHQGVPESFMAELLKLQEGREACNKFLNGLGNGWAETKGMSLRIVNKGEAQSIILSYPDKGEQKEIEITPGTINAIISRRATFEAAVTPISSSNKLEKNAEI
ncbi:MAG: hypothetical protein WCT50_03945 [Patescibacteria group bacterium]